MLKFDVLATDGAARTGELTLNHGKVQTPIFMPVGTYGAVKGMAPDDLDEVGAQIILGNTFHLWLRPGAEVLDKFGGLHGFNGWHKPILTDSGGFQVWSLGDLRKITEDGVRFASPINGDRLLLTPEVSMQVQRSLNSDIAMVFDECTPYEIDGRAATEQRGGRIDAPVAALGAPQPRGVRPAGQSERAVRHRPGRHVRGPARRVAGRAAGHRLSTASPSAACRWASRRRT